MENNAGGEAACAHSDTCSDVYASSEQETGLAGFSTLLLQEALGDVATVHLSAEARAHAERLFEAPYCTGNPAAATWEARPSPMIGRFRGKLHRRPLEESSQQQGCRPQPPTRLAGPVGGTGGDPFAKGTAACELDGAGPASRDDFSDLPAFRHLAALEEVLDKNRHAPLASMLLPDLPGNLKDRSSVAAPRSVPLGSQVVGAQAYRSNPPALPRNPLQLRGDGLGSTMPLSAREHCKRSAPLSSSARGSSTSRAPVATGPPGPQVLFREGTWGLQPPVQPGSRPHMSGQISLGHSALTGKPLASMRRGPAATTRWLGLETQQVHAEGRKPLGSSAHIAFLVNGGPEHMENLSADLVHTDLLR